MIGHVKSPPYRVAVVGASTLLGKEVTTVLKERNFPVSLLTSLETDSDDADLPILDLEAGAEAILRQEEVKPSELDIIFVAAHSRTAEASLPAFLADSGNQTLAIDLGGNIQESSSRSTGRAEDSENWIMSVPFLDREFPTGISTNSYRFISAHPVSILLAALLLRFSKQVEIERAIAQVFAPVSEISPKAIEELQSQTVKLLSFQKIPEAVFGGQLAFNVLPRLRRERRSSRYQDELTGLEGRVRSEVRAYLGGRVPVPALRMVQVPVFYSLAASLYLETTRALNPESASRELAGEHVRVKKLSEPPPSQVHVTGSDDIVVDTAWADASHENGLWIWATADNMRLAAMNAVEIAERHSHSLTQKHKDISENA